MQPMHRIFVAYVISIGISSIDATSFPLRPSCQPQCILTALTAANVQPATVVLTSSDNGTVLCATHPGPALTWLPPTTALSAWCTWTVFDVAPATVALAVAPMLNATGAWLQVPDCRAECNGGAVLGLLTGDTTSWVAEEGLVQAAWGALDSAVQQAQDGAFAAATEQQQQPPTGPETNVEFISRVVRIGLPVMATVLGVVVLASLFYIICIRYPANCCMRLLGRGMTTPVAPVAEDEQRQPRHSILMMYTNRLAQSLRPGSRRGSGQPGKRDPEVEQEPLRVGGPRGSLRSRRGSSIVVLAEVEKGLSSLQHTTPTHVVIPAA